MSERITFEELEKAIKKLRERSTETILTPEQIEALKQPKIEPGEFTIAVERVVKDGKFII